MARCSFTVTVKGTNILKDDPKRWSRLGQWSWGSTMRLLFLFYYYFLVKRCPHHIPVSDGYYQCQPGTDPLYGAVCTFGCYSGFQLVGNSQLECMYTGVWNHFPPSCQSNSFNLWKKCFSVLFRRNIFNIKCGLTLLLIRILNYIISEKTCPTLQPSVGNLKYLCTDENKYRSVCTYFCEKGYDITPGMSRVRVCTANGSWRGDKPTCKGKSQYS